jgi:hypothetical protein
MFSHAQAVESFWVDQNILPTFAPQPVWCSMLLLKMGVGGRDIFDYCTKTNTFQEWYSTVFLEHFAFWLASTVLLPRRSSDHFLGAFPLASCNSLSIHAAIGFTKQQIIDLPETGAFGHGFAGWVSWFPYLEWPPLLYFAAVHKTLLKFSAVGQLKSTAQWHLSAVVSSNQLNHSNFWINNIATRYSSYAIRSMASELQFTLLHLSGACFSVPGHCKSCQASFLQIFYLRAVRIQEARNDLDSSPSGTKSAISVQLYSGSLKNAQLVLQI